MFRGLVFLGSLLLLIPLVAAHGSITLVIIDGKSYTGDSPSPSLTKSVGKTIRLRGDGNLGPINATSAEDMQCGPQAARADKVAQATAGSQIQIKWTGESSAAHWIHQVGPMMTYIASCGSTTCDKYDTSADTQWAKIDNAGYDHSNTSKWMENRLFNNMTVPVTLPNNLKPGNYLLRHEVLAMLAPPNPEHYVGCIQLSVGGSGTGVADKTLKFPDAYNDDDSKAALSWDPFNNKVTDYTTFPGGGVANFGGTSNNSSSIVDPTPTAPSGSTATDPPSLTSSPTSSSVSSASMPTGGSGNKCSRNSKRAHRRFVRVAGKPARSG